VTGCVNDWSRMIQQSRLSSRCSSDKRAWVVQRCEKRKWTSSNDHPSSSLARDDST